MFGFRDIVSASTLLSAVALGLASPVPARAEPLGLEQALAETRASHPLLTRLRAELAAAGHRADLLGKSLTPEVAAFAGADVGAAPPLDPWDPTVSVQAGLGASWTISDFGRTSAAVAAARARIDAGGTDLRALEQDLVLRVEEVYFQALAATRLVEVAKASLAAETRHREEAERFVAAGQRAAIEVARAKTQEARARTELVRAEAQVQQTLVALAQAMGRAAPPTAVITPSLAPPPGAPVDPADAEGLVARALEGRVEVAAVRARMRAAEEAQRAASRGTAPLLAADASVGFGSRDLEEWGPSWTAGVSLTWPFWDGGRTADAEAAARAELEAARASLVELTTVIAAEVRAAQVALVSAEAEVLAADAAREAAEIELRLAEARWKEGLGSGIELADAQTRLTQTDAERTRAELARALAGVRLARALGR